MATKNNNAQGSIACQPLSFGRAVRETKTTKTITVTTFDDGQPPDRFESAQKPSGASPANLEQILAELQTPAGASPLSKINYVA